MPTVDGQIRETARNISNNIEALSDNRGLLAQNLLSQLRNLVESVAVRLHSGDGDRQFEYGATRPAIDWIGSSNKQINFIYGFHKLLQMSASHYTHGNDASERLMLKYYELLMRTRTLLADNCGIYVLDNLEKFPIDQDPSLQEYHQKIAERVESLRYLSIDESSRRRYYIHKVRPFFTDGRIFYEVVFSNALDRTSKFDRIIAFTHIDMTDRYAANLVLQDDSIDILGRTMPITVVLDWEVSIRPCELENFGRIFGFAGKINSGSIEYRNLMRYLTDTSGNLLDLMDASDARFGRIERAVTERVQNPRIFPVLRLARNVIKQTRPGHHVLRYLLLRMNNHLIKLQFDPAECGLLSDLRLSFSCIPFDNMPFCTSLKGHNPRFLDLAASLDTTGRMHELLAHRVKNNVERHGQLYTPVVELEELGPVDKLVADYNKRVYYKHTGRRIVQDKGHVFIKQYEDETVSIIEAIQKYATSGVEGYQTAVERWLGETSLNIDDDAKRAALEKLFAHSRVAIIYGAAGTGKSTMVNYIANYFGGNGKLFLAHTNPAKDNLERRVVTQNAEYRTISSHIRRHGTGPEYDVLVIDECSTVSNSDLLKVLEGTSFKLLVLVGDVYQIESIQFGNWFGIIRSFVPNDSVFELTTPYRATNPGLLDFWTKVRHLEDGIEESIAQNNYSAVLGETLFEAQRELEIVLCLNYDGLYGINNVNRFLQSNNPGRSIVWGMRTYKVGDPILFNDTDRFRPLLFNNLKGWIVDTVDYPDRVQFDIRLDRGVTAIDVDGYELRYVSDSTVSFDVYRQGNTDDDEEPVNTSVPFQVAYAVSIHKAQGLEYDSVKVVITDANEDDISHSIFYTAITRAREHLTIFWTPETQHAVLSSLEHVKGGKDVAILKSRRDVTSL